MAGTAWVTCVAEARPLLHRATYADHSLPVIQEASYTGHMKATIDIPDEIYRKVKAKSALQGRSVRDVTTELYQQWVEGEQPGTDSSVALEWLEDLLRLGAETSRDAPPGPTATEVLTADRDRSGA